jgi:CRP-like cAMP-binding protein
MFNFKEIRKTTLKLKESHKLIIGNVNRFIDLTELEKQKYISLLTEIKVKKKAYLMQAGEITKYEYFITKGCLKVYTLDEDGAPHISMFAVEDYWTGDMASFITKQPSRYFIKATEDSELLGISRANYDLLFQEIPKFEKFYRILYQRSLISYIRRSNYGISLTAEERYTAFKKKYPKIVNRITQKDLAGYIGITPEFMSKIISKVNRM